MGQQVSRDDYEWVLTEEPHKTRRREILAKHPEIKELMGHDVTLKYAVTFMVVLQLMTSYLMRDASWFAIVTVGYLWGGVINHSMTLAIHEISHNLAYGQLHPVKNRALAIFGNLILGIPYAVVFKKYHLEHHKFQGDEVMDMDLPSEFEVRFFRRTFTKVIWVILQPFFYAFRPIIIRPKPVTRLEIINFTIQISFNVFICAVFGWRSLVYLVAGTFLAMGLHPIAGHFISEHYMFKAGFETYSYYGVLNRITFNVGYHNEHHDFPNIPGSRLPQVKQIASEYYDNLPYHTSWTRVIWDFITSPDMGPSARIKRHTRPLQDNDNNKED